MPTRVGPSSPGGSGEHKVDIPGAQVGRWRVIGSSTPPPKDSGLSRLCRFLVLLIPSILVIPLICSSGLRSQWTRVFSGRKFSVVPTEAQLRRRQMQNANFLLNAFNALDQNVKEQVLNRSGVGRISGTSEEKAALKELLKSSDFDLATYLGNDEGKIDAFIGVFKKTLADMEPSVISGGVITNLLGPNCLTSFKETRTQGGMKTCESKWNVPEVKTQIASIKKSDLEEYALLQKVIMFGRSVAAHSQTNDMTAKNLGVPFGPALIRSDSPVNDAMNGGKYGELIACLIENHDAIFSD